MNENVPKITHAVRVKLYPCGGFEMMAASRDIFAEYPEGKPKPVNPSQRRQELAAVAEAAGKPCPAVDRAEDLPHSTDKASLARSMRRARARVRDIALSNRFRWFVTLTLDRTKIDRYDMSAILKVLNRWLDNRVRRDGLKYILVPERHKDGAIHFHGFFSDSVDAVPSGHYDAAGHSIYNLPAWGLGFSAAIEIFGDYPRAVSYVCKYIGKQGDKPAGRWYYSGGALEQPRVIYPDSITMESFNRAHPDCYMFQVPETGLYISMIRGENFATETL